MLAGMTTTQQHLLEWVYAHPLHIGVRDPARRARARFIQQPVEALAEKSRAPLADGLLGQSQFARDDGVRLAGAHSSTNRARSARARAVVGRRAQRSSVSRSSSVRVSGGMGRPVRMGVPPSIGGTLGVRNLFHLFTTQDTSAFPYDRSRGATARDSKLDFPAISAPASSRRIPWPLLSPY